MLRNLRFEANLTRVKNNISHQAQKINQQKTLSQYFHQKVWKPRVPGGGRRLLSRFRLQWHFGIWRELSVMLIFYVTQILCFLTHFNATTIAGSHIIKNRIVSLFSLKVCGNNNCLSEYSKSGGNWGPDDDCCTRLQKIFCDSKCFRHL